MPFVSDKAIQRVQGVVEMKDRKISALTKKVKEIAKSDPVAKALDTTEIVGGAALAGAIRGRLEDESGAFNIPGTTMDAELAGALLLVGIGLTPYAPKKLERHIANVGNGALAHYVGQVARNSVKNKSFTMMAGNALEQSLREY